MDATSSPQVPPTWRVGEFFAGIGGFRLAFEAAHPSFKTVFANDIDAQCKITYDANFPEPHLSRTDIRDIADYPEHVPDFDILVGGFPCQPFSTIGQRKGIEDSRGTLFFELMRMVDAKKPRVLLFENVKGLLHIERGTVFETMLAMLRHRGYFVDYRILDTAVHTPIPQHRERIFIVCALDPAFFDHFRFPEPVPADSRKAIQSLLEPPESVVPRYYYGPEDKAYPTLVENMKVPYQFFTLWTCTQIRKKRVGVTQTLLAGMGRGGHAVPVFFDGLHYRRLSPRECFRLQGFPDSYAFPPTLAHNHLYKQAGNGVTVTLVERLARNIATALEGLQGGQGGQGSQGSQAKK